jgi:hypothetical protein
MLLILSCVCFIFLFACSTQKKTPLPPSQVSGLPGYEIRDSNFSREDFNVWVVTTPLSFDSIFVSTTAADKKPDFESQIVVAIKAQTVTSTYRVTFKNMVVQGPDLNVYFTVAKDKPEREGSSWVTIAAIPRNKTIRRVNFFYDDILTRTIQVVRVY